MITFLKLFFRRNLVKNKLTYLNIGGLTLGMFTFLFIYFYVYTESHYDQLLPDAKNIYHLELNISKNGVNSLYSTTPIPLSETLSKEVPGIENWTTYCSIFETSVLNNGESDFLNPSVIYANPGILATFHYQPVCGNLENALGPGKTILTKSAAERYLGTTNAIGKQIKLMHDKKEPLVVTVEAVIEDIPFNSNVKFEMICNIDDYLHLVGDWVNGWFIKAGQSYITLKEGTDKYQTEQQIATVINKYMNNAQTEGQGIATVRVENILEKHFKKDFTLQHPTESFVSKTSLKILFFVGLITLIISWLNYINFLIFQNTIHFKEIGIRKIIGSSRRKLITTMLCESMLLTAIPVMLTILLFFMVSPVLYNLFHFHMDNLQVHINRFWSITLSLFFFGSMLSTIYPIIKLSNFQPIQMFQTKSKHSSLSGKNGPIILTVQFVLSILLICGIMGINAQMEFLDKQKLGFTKENILVLSPPITPNIGDYNQRMKLFKEEVSQNAGVVAIAASSSIPGKKLITEHFGLKNREETINKYLGLSTDEDYFNVIDAKFLAGKNFSDIPQLRSNEVIINEALLHRLGFSDPGEALHQKTNRSGVEIIGVVEDYHHNSLQEEVKPTLFTYGLNRLTYLVVRFRGTVTGEQIAFIKNKWEQIFTNSPFTYSFLETEYNQQYDEERQLSRVMMLFSILSVIITILGLIGSCLNSTYMKTKEIGVRKVNGAKVSEILSMLNAEFIRWVILAFIIATPIAWFAMKQWLELFAYKTTLSWWIFAFSGILSLVIAILTVSFQSWKAATRNPIESTLR